MAKEFTFVLALLSEEEKQAFIKAFEGRNDSAEVTTSATQATNAAEAEAQATNAVEAEAQTTNAAEAEAQATNAAEAEAQTTNAAEAEAQATNAVEAEAQTTNAAEAEAQTTNAAEAEAQATNAVEAGFELTAGEHHHCDGKCSGKHCGGSCNCKHEIPANQSPYPDNPPKVSKQERRSAVKAADFPNCPKWLSDIASLADQMMEADNPDIIRGLAAQIRAEAWLMQWTSLVEIADAFALGDAVRYQVLDEVLNRLKKQKVWELRMAVKDLANNFGVSNKEMAEAINS